MDVMKKFLSFMRLERIALEINERLPLSFKYRYIYGRSYLYWQAFLQESDKWDKNKIATYQLEQLKNLLSHSMKNVPYYRKLFIDYGFNPENLQNLDDVKVLPLLDKETVRDRLGELIDRRKKKLISKSTSGSVGIPLTVYMTDEAVKIYHAFLFNLFGRVGYDPGCRTVKFWNKIELDRRKNLPYTKIGNKLILSNRHLTDEWLLKYAKMIGEFRPLFITGYPSVLSILAAFIKNQGISSLESNRLKAVICHGETLKDWQRDLIEEVFNARAFSVYSMTEGSLFAGECEYSSSYHIYPQGGFVEFIVSEGGYREIVSTGFTNYAMPLIRYRTGDLVLAGQAGCQQCGRNHQLLNKVMGRLNDFLINREGKVIPRLMPWIGVFPNTKQYQFSQEEPGKAYLKVVKTQNYTDADTLFIKSKLAEMLGPMKDTIDIEIVFTDEIPRSPSGKMNLMDQRLNVRDFLKI